MVVSKDRNVGGVGIHVYRPPAKRGVMRSWYLCTAAQLRVWVVWVEMRDHKKLVWLYSYTAGDVGSLVG